MSQQRFLQDDNLAVRLLQATRGLINESLVSMAQSRFAVESSRKAIQTSSEMIRRADGVLAKYGPLLSQPDLTPREIRPQRAIAPCKTILILEDNPKDMVVASTIAYSAGVKAVHKCSSLIEALTLLEHGLHGLAPLPDAMVADLDLGQESGFELLRFWCTTSLKSIPLIVWTGLGGNHYRQTCEVFRIKHFVGKWQSQDALRDCIVSLRQ